jgi:3-hydroxybutyrate dehydrogenase
MTAKKTLEQFTQIAGKCALVTGSISGIGYATARALAAQGCKVMLHGLGDPAEIEKRVAELKAECDVKIGFHGADLTDLEQIEDLVATTERELGPVDILVNNAVARNFDAVDKISAERWNYAVAVNLSAPFHLIKMTLPGMKTRKWGRIINIASNWGLTGTVNRADYVATKHGVVGLTKAVALEALPYNVTCNAICPGSTLTSHAERQVKDRMQAGGKSWDQAARDLLAVRQPSGRFVKPEQVADLIVFLCSPAASEMTGSPVSIDGGWLAI